VREIAAEHFTAFARSELDDLRKQANEFQVSNVKIKRGMMDRINSLTAESATRDAKVAELERLNESLKKEVVGWKKYADSVKQQVRNVIDGVVGQ